ncbi:DUF305 domain-containing protein [Nonomuraea sp. MG754425]|uniref:DUF305 domain-containing protein n=1 Tax=Nonomuraea sp. MG754425 TaxID=2570319 RepID=UPI001F2C1014|nr:DUF305 domain-containing protein [Nonomuraea sp. MG754425]MCF6471890.1 DUF305 domain-containing protein [Nonomuraea sp. MG754425]
MKRRSVRTAIAAGALLAAGTLGSGATAAAMASPPPRPTCPGMGQMHPVTSEYDYLSQMIPHHEDAITAARQLQRSDRPEMRQLGQSIVTTQTAEVARMKGWLEQWYPQSPAPSPSGSTMPDLSGLSGDQLDKTFLQYMIPHHMMAIMMSQQLLMHGEAPHAEVAAFAQKVRDDQWAEVRTMRQYLVQWFGQQSTPCMPEMPEMPGMPGMTPGPHSPGGPPPTEPARTGT